MQPNVRAAKPLFKRKKLLIINRIPLIN